MAFQPAPGIAQVEMIYALGPNRMENVYHVMGQAAYTAAQLQALASIFINWEETQAKNLRTHQVGLTEVIATDLSTDSSPRFTTTDTLPFNGAVNANSYPSNVTWSVKAETGLRGRSNRGRTYWIGLWEDIVLVDQIDGTTGTAIVSVLNGLVTAIKASAPLTPCVLSRYHNKAKRDPAIGIPIVRYTATDFVTDSQRRRLPGHNRHR